MKVSVRLFAGLHDLVGKRDVFVELADEATVAQLQEQLGRDYPAVVPFLPTLVCAVDDEYVPAEHRLHDGDEVAFIPPVSGGSADEEGCFQVTTEPLEPQRLVDAVRKDESGAVALFYGVARNHNEGRRVRALEYDAHPSLAEKKLREVAEEVRARRPITGIGILHRTGRITVGETSLLVAVSAAHRREAFEACHYAVDRIKEIVPIWKKEIWEDGDGAWVAGHPVEAPQQVEAKPGA
jgi:molybdopterin synthase catalytic subunit